MMNLSNHSNVSLLVLILSSGVDFQLNECLYFRRLCTFIGSSGAQ